MEHHYHHYSTRRSRATFDVLDTFSDEELAISSPAPSSPQGMDFASSDDFPSTTFNELDIEILDPDSDEEADPTYTLPPPIQATQPRRTDQQKVVEVLRFMKAQFPRLSLRKFLNTLFRSEDGAITNWTSMFIQDSGMLDIMDLWWARAGGDEDMEDWVISRAAGICKKEVDGLTDTARKSQHYEEVKSLRLSPKDVTVKMVNSFRLGELGMKYERLTPRLQHILRAVIGGGEPTSHYERDRKHVSTDLRARIHSMSDKYITYFRVVLWLLQQFLISVVDSSITTLP